MKFVWLVLRNVFRNRRRTLLTITSIAVSLFLVTTLLTVLTELKDPAPESALRLITRRKISLFNTLPMAYRQKIARVQGVEAVVGSMWFGGVYKAPANFFAQFSVNTGGGGPARLTRRSPGLPDGLALARHLDRYGNFSTFSEVLFHFRITPTILLLGMVFATFVGVLGGGLPARRAARIKLIEALRD